MYSEASFMVYGTFATSSLIGDLLEHDHWIQVDGSELI
jgi:hypothetical protein